MLPSINRPFGIFVFAALCFGGGAGGLYVRRRKLSAHFCLVPHQSEQRILKIFKILANAVARKIRRVIVLMLLMEE